MRARRARVGLALVALLVAGVVGASTATASPAIPGIPDCKDAPVAQLPGEGVTGFLDTPPTAPPAPGDPWAAHPTTSVYEQYGYAGLTWHTYDLGCGGDVRDMGAASDTMLGDALLSVAAWGTAATNGLHNTISHPDRYMAPLDDVVGTVTQRVHDAIWSPWGGASLLGVVVLLLFYSSRGRLSDVTRAAAWALLVLSVMAGLAQYPARVSGFFDQAITGSIARVNGASAGLASLPPTADPARAQGALLVDRILYDGWLRGELGSSDSPAAKRWGPALYRAGAYTWAEARQARSSPEKATALADAKAARWKEVAQQIQDEDPATYATLQGKAGGRLGTGLMTVFGATFAGVFRLVSDLFTFAGLAMLRLLVMLFPAVAVLGVLAPLSGLVRRVANVGGASVVNVVAFAAASSVHTTVISAILSRAQLGGMNVLALVLCVVVTIVAFVLMFPLLSLTNVVGLSHGGGAGALRRVGRLVTRYAVTRQAVHDGTGGGDEPAVPGAGDSSSGRTDPAGPVRHHPALLPAEVFSRPEAAGRPAVAGRPVVATLPAAASPVAVSGAPVEGRRPPAALPAAGPGRVAATLAARQAAPARDPARDLARGLAGDVIAASPGGGAGGSLATRDDGVRPHGDVLEGVVVAAAPAPPARPGSDRVHDSHTQVRPDGIGPRLYDPATRSTVLAAALVTAAAAGDHRQVEDARR